MKKVNFQVLYDVWGIKLTPEEVEETKKSPYRALQVKNKFILLNSFVYSQHIAGKSPAHKVKGTVELPNMAEIANKSFQELMNLSITYIHWCRLFAIEFNLNDGQICKVGAG